jgi:hypothetical protein
MRIHVERQDNDEVLTFDCQNYRYDDDEQRLWIDDKDNKSIASFGLWSVSAWWVEKPPTAPVDYSGCSEYFGDLLPNVSNTMLACLTNINKAHNRIEQARNITYKVTGLFNLGGQFLGITLTPKGERAGEQ